MNISRIEIKISDSEKLRRIALLVDRKDFLGDVYAMRQALLISRTYLRSEIKKEIIHFETKYKDNHFHINFALLKTKSYSDIQKSLQKIKGPLFKYHWYMCSDSFVPFLLHKYGLNYYFHDVLWYSILTGEVIEEDFIYITSGIHIDQLNEPYNSSDEMLEYGGANDYIFTLTPETTMETLTLVYNRYRKNLNSLKKKKRNNFIRDREWYWLKLSGLSYGEILKQAQSKNEKITRDGVIKAIKHYEEGLTVEIKSNPMFPQKLS